MPDLWDFESKRALNAHQLSQFPESPGAPATTAQGVFIGGFFGIGEFRVQSIPLSLRIRRGDKIEVEESFQNIQLPPAIMLAQHANQRFIYGQISSLVSTKFE